MTRSLRFVEVVLPVPIQGTLIYHLPTPFDHRSLAGKRVLVPLGNRKVVGCLLGEIDLPPNFKTKEVLTVWDEEPLLSPFEIRFLRWAASYYLTPLGEVLRHLVPKALFQDKPIGVKKAKPFPRFEPVQPHRLITLNEEQKSALRIILEEMEASKPKPVLIDGITGSGKTEVYSSAVQATLERKRQALVLVPEIGLTPQAVEVFQDRLKGMAAPVSVYHSALTEGQRYEIWRRTKSGELLVVIGTRSAVFLPFRNLGLVVIDEEQDPSFKQEERFCYHARDLGLWRGYEQKIPVILGSATPSLESLFRARNGKMRRVVLSQRPMGASLPGIEVVDQRIRGSSNGQGFLSDRLLGALRENLKKGGQTLLFLNRRGFSNFVLCAQCGFVPRCGECDISLTLHKKGNPGGLPLLICHYCDREVPFLPTCGHCHVGSLTPFGTGTQKVDEELRSLFPGAKIARMDRDTTKKGGWREVPRQMKKGEIDILVGTQMITKGHDYPGVTLVGIIDADATLNLPDFRAGERTFQMITQASGRAGRADRPGRVFVQTYRPSDDRVAAAVTANRSLFYEKELRQREEAGYPPYRRLIEIRLSGSRRDVVIEASQKLGEEISRKIPQGLVLLGPAPCPVERVRGRFRWRLLLKTGQYTAIQSQLALLLDGFSKNNLPSTLRMLVNVDPMEMM